MENVKLSLYYRGITGVKNTDIEIAEVIKKARLHYIVTGCLGMCSSIEDAIQDVAKDIKGLNEWKTIKENIPLFNFGVAAQKFGAYGLPGGYWWGFNDKKQN